MIRYAPQYGRLGDTGVADATIVSAVDAATGAALDPGSFGLYPCADATGLTCGANSSPEAVNATGPVSGQAACGQGGGTGNLYSPIGAGLLPVPNPLANAINMLLVIAVVGVAVYLIAERNR